MILDARRGDRADVYDAKTCRMVKDVVWLNDATAQWGRWVLPPRPGACELVIEVVQEDRITIYPARALVIFNEVDDNEPAARRETTVDHAWG